MKHAIISIISLFSVGLLAAANEQLEYRKLSGYTLDKLHYLDQQDQNSNARVFRYHYGNFISARRKQDGTQILNNPEPVIVRMQVLDHEAKQFVERDVLGIIPRGPRHVGVVPATKDTPTYLWENIFNTCAPKFGYAGAFILFLLRGYQKYTGSTSWTPRLITFGSFAAGAALYVAYLYRHFKKQVPKWEDVPIHDQLVNTKGQNVYLFQDISREVFKYTNNGQDMFDHDQISRPYAALGYYNLVNSSRTTPFNTSS